MFIEKMWTTPLEFRKNGIEDKHIVPTGLKGWRLHVFYKHSVPTKSTPNAPNQRYECHLGIPRMAFGGTKMCQKLYTPTLEYKS